MDSTLVIKNSYTYCKNLQVSKAKYYAHAPRGIDWQEKTIARPRPPLIWRKIKEHLMFQICYITFTIRACYGTDKLQHKYFSIHNYSTSTTLISLPPCLKTIIKHQTSLSIQQTHKKVFTSLEYLVYQDYLSKLPSYLRLSNNLSEA